MLVQESQASSFLEDGTPLASRVVLEVTGHLSSCVLSLIRLFATPWTVAYQTPWSMGFSRYEYWSGLSFPSPEDLPHPGIEPWSPTLQADRKIKSDTVSTVSPSISHEVVGPDAMIFVF